MSGGDDDDRITLGSQHTILPDPRRTDAPPPAVVDPSKAPVPEATPTVLRPAKLPSHRAAGGTQILAPNPPSEGPRETRDASPADGAFGFELAHTMISAEASSLEARVQVGKVLAGKYELVELLGSGGMGQVYKGQHRTLGVPIAVKTMHPHVAMQPEYVRRFRREAYAASVINHPNVVRVLDFGEEEGLLYLVMEFLAGRSLGTWLDGLRAPPPLADVQRIMGELLDAFAVAHAHEVVHRDLKPDNVFLAEISGKQIVKVVDFGLARVDDARDTGPKLTSTDAIAGTPDYMSPEQCRSLSVGPSADLYSIGCVLTALLQLAPPFHGGSSIDTMAKHMFTRPGPLKRPAGAEPVPPLLEKLRLDLLAKVAERRPKDAAEAKARLVEAMSAEGEALRLPTRKGDVPIGDRASRAPAWTPEEQAVKTPRVIARAVGLWPVGDASGVGAACETALAAQAIDVVTVVRATDAAAEKLPVVVIDAGADIAEGRARIAALKAASPRTQVLVCAAGLDTEKINELVAAGAADVARYPIAPDALVKKIDRVLRRGR